MRALPVSPRRTTRAEYEEIFLSRTPAISSFVGHTGSGKTTLLDALLYKLGVSDRLGSPASGHAALRIGPRKKERKIRVGEAV
jgi:translation elongation factor EF-G